MVTINESGMKFGPFPDDIVYRIEKSNIYTSLGNSVKTVEFLYKAKTRKLFFIEAKSSSPRPDGERFVDYIDEISSKFIHSFHFWLTLKLNRRQDNISPELLDFALDSQIFHLCG